MGSSGAANRQQTSEDEAGLVDELGVERWERMRDRRTLAVLVLLAWAVYLATATYSSYQVNDNRAVNISAWSLGTRGTLALPDHFEGAHAWLVEGKDGNVYSNRFPGPILWAAPFHAAGERVMQRGEPDHPVFLNFAPGGVAAATVTALAVGASFLVFRRLADRRLAVGASLVLAFGTGVWSVSADAMWAHGLTHLTLILGVLAAADGRNVRAGAAFAASVLARPHTAVVAAVVGLWSGWRSRRVRPVVVIGVVSGLGVVALAIYSQALFGTWQPIAGYRSTAITAAATTGPLLFLERAVLTLGHPARGVLIYTPFLLVFAPFLHHGWRASPWWVRAAALGGCLYLVVQLLVNTWTGGSGFFGSRLTLETLVLAAPLLLRTWQVSVRHDERWKGAAVGLMLVAALTHAVGATVRSVHPESREEWTQAIEEFCAENPEVDGCQD
jgi:hypothetical protein